MSQFSRRLIFPLLAILPPTLIALATEDVGILVRVIVTCHFIEVIIVMYYSSVIMQRAGDNHGCLCWSWNPVRDPGNSGLACQEEACPVGGGGDACHHHLDADGGDADLSLRLDDDETDVGRTLLSPSTEEENGHERCNM